MVANHHELGRGLGVPNEIRVDTWKLFAGLGSRLYGEGLIDQQMTIPDEPGYAFGSFYRFKERSTALPKDAYAHIGGRAVLFVNAVMEESTYSEAVLRAHILDSDGLSPDADPEATNSTIVYDLNGGRTFVVREYSADDLYNRIQSYMDDLGLPE